YGACRQARWSPCRYEFNRSSSLVEAHQSPKIYSEGATKVRLVREAYLYFPSAECKLAAMSQRLRLGTAPLSWFGNKVKACYECSDTTHFIRDCPQHKAKIAVREHKARVQRFASTGSFYSEGAKSFARAVNGSSG